MMTDPTMSWKKPVEVFGYNDAVHFFGRCVFALPLSMFFLHHSPFYIFCSIFEAETNCIAEHNMGQVAIITITMMVMIILTLL